MPNNNNQVQQRNQSQDLDRFDTGFLGASLFFAGTSMIAGSGGLLTPIGAGIASFGIDLMARSIGSESTPEILSAQSAQAAVVGATAVVTGGIAAGLLSATSMGAGTAALASSALGGMSGHVAGEVTGKVLTGQQTNINVTSLATSAIAGPASLVAGTVATNAARGILPAAATSMTRATVGATSGAAATAMAKTARNGIEVVTGKRRREDLLSGVGDAAVMGATIGAATSLVNQNCEIRQDERRRKVEVARKPENQPVNSANTQNEDSQIAEVRHPTSSANTKSFFTRSKASAASAAVNNQAVTKEVALEMIKQANNSLLAKPPELAAHNFVANNIATQCFKNAFGIDSSNWDWLSFDNLQGQLLKDQKGNSEFHNCRMARTIFNFFGQPANWDCSTSSNFDLSVNGKTVYSQH